MKVEVNGKAREITEGRTVADLLEELDLDPRTVVVERNREIVPRRELPAVILESGDRLELVHFVGGG